MTYIMDQDLINHINAQRKEAEEFSKKPGCWMGSLPAADDYDYWSGRVPTGTLREFNRIELEESAYYAVADAYSKSLARAYNFSAMSDDELELIIEDACDSMERERKSREEDEAREEDRLNRLADELRITRSTLDRWINEGLEEAVYA